MLIIFVCNNIEKIEMPNVWLIRHEKKLYQICRFALGEIYEDKHRGVLSKSVYEEERIRNVVLMHATKKLR